MANINFTDYENQKQTNSNFKDRPKIGYFNTLKDDGDETFVRFNYNTKADFKVVTIHRVKLDGNWRNVSCLKENPYKPADTCPLCASGDQMKARVFASLIEYSKDDSGKIIATPKVWERPYKFVGDLDEAMKDAVEDGVIPANTNICDVVFRVRRKGAKGDVKTEYKVKVANPSVFPANTYVKDFSAFEGFDAAHHSYMVKTADEIKTYLETGAFPAKVKTPAPEAPAPAPARDEVLEAQEKIVDTESDFSFNRPHRYSL